MPSNRMTYQDWNTLEKADLVIFLTRLLTLPEDQLKHIVRYLDSGKPIIGLRTANHGFRGALPYSIKGKKVRFGELLGGTFLGHHGNWHRDSTRGDIVPEMKEHPILIGVRDIWGPSDVYRTYKEGSGLPEDCTALVMGQPLIGRKQHGANNPKENPPPGGMVQELGDLQRDKLHGSFNLRWAVAKIWRTLDCADSSSMPPIGDWEWKIRSPPKVM
jgi:hypothetical protein